MGRPILILLFGMLLYPQFSIAETPAVDTHAEAARNLLMTMHVEKQMALGTEIMADQFIRTNPTLGPYRDVLLKWAASFMTWDEFGPRLVALYQDAFTEVELRDLAKFYKSPLGQKASRSVIPDLTRHSAELGGAAAKEHRTGT